MIRRLLTFWLVVSILGLGISFASDVHVEEILQQSFQQTQTQDDGNLTQDMDQHDLSCHGIIHLLGLNSTPLAISPRTDHKPEIPYSARAARFTASSLFRPPILI